jgi:mannose-6-phosphate isomerase
VAEAAGAARRWLADHALPLWGVAGVDEDGSFHERLMFDGRPERGSFRRMRVQARQVYVFSEAALRGWWPQAGGVAEAGFEALLRNNWGADGRPGFVHSLKADKTPLDVKRDTYDHAFGLFALAWYYRLARAPRALALAHEILDLLERDLADPVNGGFAESVPPALPRRSDPHMHLLEAALEWVEETGEPRFRALAERLIRLFQDRFFNRQAGALTEYFGADLRPAEGAAGQVVAPGHHFEWFWLLDRAASLGLQTPADDGRALYGFGVSHGIDARGFAVDECDTRGHQVRRSRRAWPQSELIKAHLVAAERGERGAAEAAARLTLDFQHDFLATSTPGLWMDQLDENGRGVSAAVPASTFYHVMVAFRELILFAEAA